ncbi:tRNA-uridine aminocarboxypropyltransferase [Oryzisolibacter propanilivorax]|uniref:tRNA-uridine aminocarboxypropyltransferase n=1 Tax=Oryzisolibacter propanilivorax TaxID=1527607 RepID=UPI000B867011|nr:tRNA-uridine aminocarboxypropyltransferase [Oryzisolibacter propanilivorax]
MKSSPIPRRAVCSTCLRPQRSCICAAVRCVAHQAQVLILQHPLEEHHAKGTGRLLHLCLARSRLLVGEAFAPDALAHALHGPWDAGSHEKPRHTLLLYPPTPPGGALSVRAPPPLPANWLAAPERLRLVLLDATWRKSRRMLWANPQLQQLPRLALEEAALPASRYAVRRAHAPHQRSTLEATAQALAQLEPDNAQLPAALHAAMDAFVAQLQAQQRSGSAMLTAPPPAS